MGKHKHRKPSADVPKPALLSAAVQPMGAAETAPRESISRRIFWQLAGLIGLSAALGFTFNAASPVGIRFGGDFKQSASTAAVSVKDFKLHSASSSTTVPSVIASLPEPAAQISSVSTSFSRVPITNPQTVVKPSTTNIIAPPPVTNPSPIHWLEAKPLVAKGEALLVDVRPKSTYDAGHIPGAISLPESSLPGEFAAFIKEHPTNVALIVYCSSTSCSQSARVANRLVQEFRYASVKYMTGGYLEYQQQELAGSQPKSQP